ncbi:hypothetical protein J2R62_17930, partial [Plesiomonas shigelloides]|nr:hypothetical protein [Plesiomonas shigelloides]
GGMCGFAGVYLWVGHNAGVAGVMPAGQVYIALAAVICGEWRPWPSLGACLLLGFLTALETRRQGVSVPGIGVLPTKVFSALPYVLTVILMAVFIGRSVDPKAVGKPYLKER